MDRIDVYAFVNDEAQWTEFRESLQEAGFQGPIRLSDRDTDPYETITRLGQGDGYAVLCHQDVRFDHGVGERELRALINELSARDPCWTVAGNAGVTREGRAIWRPEDPSGLSGVEFPVEAFSLDEHFLILNRFSSPRCSGELSGFHFYGADVCLNALRDGGSAYIITTDVSHLSIGTRDAAYDEAKERFLSAWNDRYWFRYVGTTTTAVFLSRSRLLRRIFGSGRLLSWVGLHRREFELQPSRRWSR